MQKPKLLYRLHRLLENIQSFILKLIDLYIFVIKLIGEGCTYYSKRTVIKRINIK